MTEKIYRYVVRYDGGSAPNPFGNCCSLAICKAPIRRMAQVGDWILGFRSRSVDQVVYVMHIEQRLSFSEYWKDKRFASKRPDNNPCSDNIYRPDENGALIWEPNEVHDEGHMDDDLGGNWVLLGREFWYFGDQSPQLPTDLVHLIHQGVGYSVHKNRRTNDHEVLKQWLGHWKHGIHGKPIDREINMPALIERSTVTTCSRPRKSC
ncbi:MAG: hypothetical protein ABI606_16795 [Rhodoferax sp.]